MQKRLPNKEISNLGETLKNMLEDARLSLRCGRCNEARAYIIHVEKLITQLEMHVLAGQRSVPASTGAAVRLSGFNHKQLYERRG